MSENPEATETAAAASETELPAERVRELAGSGEADVIDVRREYEWEEGRLPGSRHIEVNDVTANIDSIAKDRPVIFYCRSGNRSGMIATAFREAGYDAHNMAGGITAWAEAGYPLEPEGGAVAESRPPSAEDR